jgi:hypothetical protein
MGATVATLNGSPVKKDNECQRVEPQQSVDRSGQSVRRRLAGNHEHKKRIEQRKSQSASRYEVRSQVVSGFSRTCV